MTTTRLQLDGVLNSATRGCQLAVEVQRLLEAQEKVEIDFLNVERVTPSFANAFVMPLLEREADVFAQSVRLVQLPEFVAVAIEASVSRYQRGVRLSTQLA